ncbi:formylglycine-generating enzyme family protein [Streptomyces sp. NPDC088762]|uniref:formylglycine-generating enzyme family protein n=1 Tax=Streptomyces sp. NPDC088762 TaxID=3365891 RepID=UPI0037F2B5E5
MPAELRRALRATAVTVPAPASVLVPSPGPATAPEGPDRPPLLVMRTLMTNHHYATLLNALEVPDEGDGISLYINAKNPAFPLRYDPAAGRYRVRPGREDHPVIGVPWLGARLAAEAVGGRLLSEDEWEHCATAGIVGRTYPWGETEPVETAANFGENVGSTTPVGAYPANDLGFTDMAGNAEEWTSDWFTPHRRDRDTPSAAGTYEKVVKGGAWNKSAALLACSARRGRWYIAGSASISFRVVWEG